MDKTNARGNRLSFSGWTLIFVLSLVTVINVFGQNGNSLLRYYPPKEYLGPPQIYCIDQHHNGVLYFATASGILEYDGESWQSSTSGADKFSYRSILWSGDTLFAGLSNDFGYLLRDSVGRLTFRSLKPPDQTTGSIWRVIETQGKIFFSSVSAVWVFDLASKHIQTLKAIEKPFASPFLYGQDYYIKQRSTGILKYEQGQLVMADSSVFKDAGIPAQLGRITKGRDYVYLNDGRRISMRNLKVSDPQGQVYANYLENGNYVYVSEEFNGWFNLLGSVSSGVLVVDSANVPVYHLNQKNGLPEDDVYSMKVDRSQNLWIGLVNGVAKVEGLMNYRHWDKTNGLKGVVSAIQRFDKTLYVATSSSLYAIDEQGNLSEPEKPSASQFWGFQELVIPHQQKKMFVAANNEGVVQIDGNRVTQKVLAPNCHFILQRKSNAREVIINERYKLVLYKINDDLSFSRVHELDGLPGSVTTAIEDGKGTIWISTFNAGLVRVDVNNADFSKSRLSVFSEAAPGFRPFIIRDTVVLTTPRGLKYYHESDSSFHTYVGLGNTLADSTRDVFLISARNGKYYVSPSSNTATDIGIASPASSGNRTMTWYSAPFRQLPAVSSIESQWVDQDGTFWLGTTDGLFRYTPANDFKNYQALPFACLIRQIVLGKQTIYPNTMNEQGWSTDYSDNELTIHFAAPFFDKEDATLYACKLDGLDKKFSQWSPLGAKEYTNLSEGNYVFHVKALNVYGVESAEVSFAFSVSPPWFRSWWAYISYFFLSIISVGAIVQFRTRYIRKLNQELEVKVKTRTSELSQALDDLTKTQAQLIESEKMASLGTLTGGIAHELNNPLNYIQGGMEALKVSMDSILPGKEGKQAEDVQEIQGALEIIEMGIDRCVGIVKSLGSLAPPIEHMAEPEDVDLTEIVNDSLVLLSEKLRQGNITVSKNFQSVPTIQAQTRPLMQAFTNLIENAILAVLPKEGPRTITISLLKGSDTITVKIADNGVGMTEEVKQKMFEPFFTTRDVGKGRGLGLFIAYGNLRKFHAEIKVESVLEEGTEFTIVFNIPDAHVN